MHVNRLFYYPTLDIWLYDYAESTYWASVEGAVSIMPGVRIAAMYDRKARITMNVGLGKPFMSQDVWWHNDKGSLDVQPGGTCKVTDTPEQEIFARQHGCM